MNARDPLECELERLVKANDLAGLKDLVAFIEEERKKGISRRAVLQGVNPKNQTLLHVALCEPDIDIAIFEFLFQYLKDDELILSDDAHGRSLVLYATANNKPDIALMLIHHQSTHPKFADHPLKESWKRGERLRGNKTLHVAASHPASDLLTYLVTHGDIHVRNTEGKTPLHMACKYKRFDNIARFANLGADLYDADHQGKTFFTYFLKFNDEQKIKVFRQLKNEKQLQVLQFFRNKLANKKLHLDEEKRSAMESTYETLMIYRVSAPRSLQELILSKIPYDPEAEFPLIHGLPIDAMHVVPHYQRRVLIDERKEFNTEKKKAQGFFARLFSRPATLEEDVLPVEAVIPKSKNQVLDEDRDTVLDLMEKVETYQIYLVDRKMPINKWKIGSSFGLTGLGLSAMFFGVFFLASNSLLTLAVATMVFAGLTPFIGGAILVIIGLLLCLAAINETFVQHRETTELTQQLDQEVLQKLEVLEKRDASLSPVNKSVIEELRSFVSYMVKRVDSHRKDLIEKFQGLQYDLDVLLIELNRTKKPFSPVPIAVEKPAPHHPLPARQKQKIPDATQQQRSEKSPPINTHWASFHNMQSKQSAMQTKINRFSNLLRRGIKNV
jgi:hypothetical protein